MIRGATLVHGLSLFPGRALCRVPSYPRQLTYALTSWNTPWQLVQCSYFGLTTPSAVHLTTCFLPDSQQHGLSGKASSPLSPLQRFSCCVLVYHVFWPLSTGQRQICHFNSYTGHRIAIFLTISQGDHISFVLLSRSSKNSFMRMSGLRRTRPSSRARGMKTKSFSRSSQ